MAIQESIIKALNDVEQTQGQDKQALRALKRVIGIMRSQYEMSSRNGMISYEQLTKTLLEIREKTSEDIVAQKTINEILQMVADDYKTQGREDASKEIYKQLLGKSGANLEYLGYDYIVEIIKEKINEQGLANGEIINILAEQVYNEKLTRQEYQKMIEDIFVVGIENAMEEDLQQIENPKVLSIIEDLAISYKGSRRIEDAIATYKKVELFKQFEDTPLYAKILENLQEMQEYMQELEQNFSERDASIENLEVIIREGILKVQDRLIIEEVEGQEGSTINTPRNLMSQDVRIRALCEAIGKLRETNPHIDIDQIKLGGEVYDGYCIIPLKETNISFLENFSDNKSNALYIVREEKIEEIFTLSKKGLRNTGYAIPVNHVNDYETYVAHIVEYAQQLMEKNVSELGLDEKLEDTPKSVRRVKRNSQSIASDEKEQFSIFEQETVGETAIESQLEENTEATIESQSRENGEQEPEENLFQIDSQEPTEESIQTEVQSLDEGQQGTEEIDENYIIDLRPGIELRELINRMEVEHQITEDNSKKYQSKLSELQEELVELAKTLQIEKLYELAERIQPVQEMVEKIESDKKQIESTLEARREELEAFKREALQKIEEMLGDTDNDR